MTLIERAKELDSRYLEWDHYRTKYFESKSLSPYFRRLMDRAWASYEKLRDSSKGLR